MYSALNNKKIIVLGGGLLQMPLIERAKRRGAEVVLCDFRNDVPGIAISNKHYQINTLQSELVSEVVCRENPDGIVTTSEPTFISMAKVATDTGLRCMSIESTLLYKNKYLMREFCRQKGILTPQYRRCTTKNEVIDFFKQHNKKCIIKPLDNSASKGVFSINSISDIEKHFDDSVMMSTSHDVIVEEYITGTEFTIDGIKINNKHYSLAISEKRHYDYNENVAYQLLFSQRNQHFDYSKLRVQNDYLVEQTEVPFTLTHAEYKYNSGKFYLIEIQARGGGNYIASDIVPYISGVDTYNEYISWALGEDRTIDFNYNNLSDNCAVLYFFDAPGDGGVVKNIMGLDFFDSHRDCLQYELNFTIGDHIGQAENDMNRIGYYILKADSLENLTSMMKQIEEKFKIEYEK